MKKLGAILGLLILAPIGAALAAGYFTNGVPVAGSVPNTIPLTGVEQAPFDTEAVSPVGEAITTNQLVNYGASQPIRKNALIGGDATTNLFQRGIAGASVTTAVTYGGPDRWAYWSGAATAMTVSQDTTIGDVPSGYKAAFKMARTSGQTGTVQVCMAQEIESNNSYQFQNSTAELDFHANAGANFSGSSIKAYVIYGTGIDEGTVNLAFGLNAGGGGSAGWAGQTNAAAATINITATNTRYAVFASIPATATEVAVAFCYTPSGTAGSADYVALAAIQLTRSPTNAALVNPTGGYVASSIQAAAFDRRLQGLETLLQYRYFYKISETTTRVERGLCRSRGTTTCSWDVKFPTVMRANPSMVYTAGFALETTAAGGTLGNCTNLATDSSVSSNAASPTDAYALCTAGTVPAAGTVDQIYDNSGSGSVSANAEL